MSRKNLPGYLLHKPTNQARVVIKGQTFYLGVYGSSESRQKYQEILSEYLNNQEKLPIHLRKGAKITVDELAERYREYAKGYYQKNGRTTVTYIRYDLALRQFTSLYGSTRISEFGPLALQRLRDAMIDTGLARRTVNDRFDCIRNVFRWAVANELCDESIHSALMKVKRLEKGRCRAHDYPPILAVPDEDIEKTLEYLLPVVADMVRVQRLTGCRPSEVCLMRICDFDFSKKIWKFIPFEHKTEHHNKHRWIAVGFRAQEILKRYMDLNQEPTNFLFRPEESVKILRKIQRKNRKTPVQPSQENRRTQDPLRKAGKRYPVQSYRTAIQRACRKAGVSIWSPNQLRHKVGTDIRNEFGLDYAQAVLGHSSAATSEIYAQLNFEKAIEVIEKIG